VGAVIYGRSDATINRHGIRMGTAELYRAVEACPRCWTAWWWTSSTWAGPAGCRLFVVLRDGLQLDDALSARASRRINPGGAVAAPRARRAIYQVPAIPAHAVGQEDGAAGQEAAAGRRPGQVLNRDAMANADSLDWFVAYAAQRAAQS
jgi:acetoacetyl-CoA synthetase